MPLTSKKSKKNIDKAKKRVIINIIQNHQTNEAEKSQTTAFPASGLRCEFRRAA